jgi:hypothetical protein
MPIFVLLLIASLAGCAPASQESQLANYLNDSARGIVSGELSGAARDAQVRALRLLSDLGWSQSGQAKYSDFEILDDSHFEFCLDVSGIYFTDKELQPVELERGETRLLMQAETEEIAGVSKITDLKEVGNC